MPMWLWKCAAVRLAGPSKDTNPIRQLFFPCQILLPVATYDCSFIKAFTIHIDNELKSSTWYNYISAAQVRWILSVLKIFAKYLLNNYYPLAIALRLQFCPLSRNTIFFTTFPNLVIAIFIGISDRQLIKDFCHQLSFVFFICIAFQYCHLPQGLIKYCCLLRRDKTMANFFFTEILFSGKEYPTGIATILEISCCRFLQASAACFQGNAWAN